jgi:hypothetical protein
MNPLTPITRIMQMSGLAAVITLAAAQPSARNGAVRG